MRVEKKVWITGASSGLGRQLAIDVAKRGDIPVLFARNDERLESLQSEIAAFGQRAYRAKMDVSDFNSIEPIVYEMLQKAGGVDVLINNAGFAIFDYLQEASFNDINEMFNVNVLGLMKLTQTVLPVMIEQDSGHIINIASQAGKFPTPKASVYAATKHAVLGFTNGLRMELAQTSIKVTAINPGPIQTSFFERADKDGNYVKNVERWMLKPEYVSEQILRIIDRPKRELNLPRWMGIGTKIYQLMPSLVEKAGGNKLFQK